MRIKGIGFSCSCLNTSAVEPRSFELNCLPEPKIQTVAPAPAPLQT
jgi:hypothetical protein